MKGFMGFSLTHFPVIGWVEWWYHGKILSWLKSTLMVLAFWLCIPIRCSAFDLVYDLMKISIFIHILRESISKVFPLFVSTAKWFISTSRSRQRDNKFTGCFSSFDSPATFFVVDPAFFFFEVDMVTVSN